MTCKVADFGLSRELENDDMDGAYWTKVCSFKRFYSFYFNHLTFERVEKFQYVGLHLKLLVIENLHQLQTCGVMVC